VTAPGRGSSAQVKVWDGATGALLSQFLAYDASFRGGVHLVAGDIGHGEVGIVTGTDAGGSPQVRVFNGSGVLRRSLDAYAPSFTGGVRVALGYAANGNAAVFTAAGPGGAPQVTSIEIRTGQTLASFTAYATTMTAGVWIAAADLTGDGVSEIVTGTGQSPQVKVFSGTGRPQTEFLATSASDRNGVSVGVVADREGQPRIATLVGNGRGKQVRLFDPRSSGTPTPLGSFRAAGAGDDDNGGRGTFTFSYTVNENPLPIGDLNAWVVKTVETLPDGNQNIVYTNAARQVMLRVFKNTATGQEWRTFFQYDANGRVILAANLSAVTGYDEAYTDLLNNQYGDYQYLADATGLVTTWTFGLTTTATETTAGDAAGRLKQVAVRRGEFGPAVPQQDVTYVKRTAGGSELFFEAGVTAYRNDDGSGAQTTTFAYTWQGSTAQPASIVTTLPTVAAAQNGPGTATTLTTVFDAFGRPIWQKDGDGFLTYTAYDQATGAVVKQIRDVDTTQTSTFTNLPSGWTTPAGGGLHLTTTYEVDALGRVTKTTHPNGRVDYFTYNDVTREVRTYAGWDAAGNVPTGPTQVVRADWANGYVETLTMSAASVVSGERPTGTEAVNGLQTLSRPHTNAGGQVVTSDAYFNLAGLVYTTSTNLGAANTHFYRTEFGYDAAGRLDRTLAPSGTIYRTVVDGLGRVVSQWVGLDDTPTTGTWSPSNTAGTDLIKLSESEYDGGGVGDGNLTRMTQFPGLGAAPRVTQTWYDWRNRAVAVKAGVEASESAAVNRPLSYVGYDNLGQVIVSEVYDGDAVSLVDANADGVPDRPSALLLRGKSTASFDDLGRVFRTAVFSVDPVTGAVSSSALTGNTWYDQRGQVVKTTAPGGSVTKYRYDGAGRLLVTFATDGGGDASWADALSVSGDVVLTQTEYDYDANGNVLLTTRRQRFHDASGTGELGTPTSGVAARVSYVGLYYDLADRPVATVDVGTNGGTEWTRPSTVPARSDTVLVTSQAYNAAGWVETVTDPRGIVNKTYYDNLGRTTKTIAHYVTGVVGDDHDITTEFTYNAVGLTSLTARRPDGSGQTTQWVYGVSLAAGSGLNSNDLVGQTRWPDPATGNASSAEQETVTVNALGQTLTATDRNGNTHTLTFDILGRLVADAVTTLGANVDGAVRRIEYAYDAQGNAALITSYDAVTGGNVVNQVKREFNGLGQLTSEWQEHGGAVTGSSPRVQYAYSEMADGANHSRVVSITYPDGRVLNYNYAAGLDNAVSRLSSLSDSTGVLESYDYLGEAVVVSRKHPQPGVDLTYVKRAGEANGDAGDPYTGLDRFGRIVDQRWLKSSDGSALDRLQYSYDRNGNRLSRTNLIDAAFSESYSYDNLNQLVGFTRGSHNRSWDYDAQGNWQSVTTDGSTQTRSHNAQNEITGIGGATTPTYDANGNLTGDETGRQLVYDAWNRLVEVKDAAGATLKSYAYDGLHRRVRETAGGVTTDLYYSDAWQVLEERVGGQTMVQYVWSPVYVDALVLRDRDSNGDGTLDERLYVAQDANYNVTALLDNAGSVVERYVYDPFGQAMVLDANWNVLAASAFAWVYLHQGGRFDGTSGLYHFRHRDYSPTLGRWTSLDPLGYEAGDVNLYRAIGNQPANTTDPSGLVWPFSTIAGAVIGAVVGGGAQIVSNLVNGRPTFQGVGGAMVGGAVTGAIVGTVGPAGLATTALTGAGAGFVGSATGNAVNQFYYTGTVNGGQVLQAGAIGAIAGGVGGGVGSAVSGQLGVTAASQLPYRIGAGILAGGAGGVAGGSVAGFTGALMNGQDPLAGAIHGGGIGGLGGAFGGSLSASLPVTTFMTQQQAAAYNLANTLYANNGPGVYTAIVGPQGQQTAGFSITTAPGRLIHPAVAAVWMRGPVIPPHHPRITCGEPSAITNYGALYGPTNGAVVVTVGRNGLPWTPCPSCAAALPHFGVSNGLGFPPYIVVVPIAAE
jgi:RHS repeat-associated protein